jgi:hypothetical protein
VFELLIMTTYTCPVCGFKELEEPPEDFNICPCCGTEFGYHDVGHSDRELRNAWLKKGGMWSDVEDNHYPTRANWNAWSQLDMAGLPYDVPNPFRRVQVENVRISAKSVVAEGGVFGRGAA